MRLRCKHLRFKSQIEKTLYSNIRHVKLFESSKELLNVSSDDESVYDKKPIDLKMVRDDVVKKVKLDETNNGET